MLVSVAPGVSAIVSGVVDNVCMVRITLDSSWHLLLASMASRGSISTWYVRFIATLVANFPRTFLEAVDVAWYSRFDTRLIWLPSRSTW